MAIVFDTRNAVQRLIKNGLSETQADAVVDVVSDATTVLVTKDDLLRAMHELWRGCLERHDRRHAATRHGATIAFQTMPVFTGIAIVTGIVAALTKL